MYDANFRDRWFAWRPVHANAPEDRSKKSGLVWLCDVEVLVPAVPGDDRHEPSPPVYRKLPLGKIDRFGLRQSPQFPTLATDPITERCALYGCQDKQRTTPPSDRRRRNEGIEMREWSWHCECPTCRENRAPRRGEADQFGGPRILK